MPELWIHVAAACYAAAVLLAAISFRARAPWLSTATAGSAAAGALFHLVAFVEASAAARGSWQQTWSLLALLMVAGYLLSYPRFRSALPAAFVMPVALALTLITSMGHYPETFSAPLLRKTSVMVHIALILAGYAALFISMSASLLYLAQEERLKRKRVSWLDGKLPPLETVDQVGHQALLWGFPLMTAGLLLGTAIAERNFGAGYFRDVKVVSSLFAWVIYLLLLVARWSAGWRGRRAAILITVAVVSALGAGAANYFSQVHRYLTP